MKSKVQISEPEIKNKPNPYALYIRNAKATFFGGYIAPVNGEDLLAPIMWLLHTITLPITSTLVAGALTYYELQNRKLLSDEDVENLKLHLKEIDPEQFDQVVLLIINKSINFTEEVYDLTTQLQEKLKEYNDEAMASHKAVFTKARLDFKQKREQQLKEEMIQSLFSKNDGSISIQLEYSLTNQDLDEISNSTSLKQQNELIDNQKRINQTEAIISYINNNLNAGSKMVNDINDMVNKSYSF